MPVVKPISDLQRNLGAIADECHSSGKPVYLTKNGAASLVVMDAKSFDERYAAMDELLERETRIQRAISRGYDDMLNGRTRSWSQAREDAEKIREMRNAQQ